MRLSWTLRAREDLVSIGSFVARHDPMAARRWVSRLRARARHAARFPRSGRMVPEVGREDVREVIVGNYRIVYRIFNTRLDILTVFEGHREWPSGLPASADL